MNTTPEKHEPAAEPRKRRARTCCQSPGQGAIRREQACMQGMWRHFSVYPACRRYL